MSFSIYTSIIKWNHIFNFFNNEKNLNNFLKDNFCLTLVHASVHFDMVLYACINECAYKWVYLRIGIVIPKWYVLEIWTFQHFWVLRKKNHHLIINILSSLNWSLNILMMKMFIFWNKIYICRYLYLGQIWAYIFQILIQEKLYIAFWNFLYKI